MKQNVPEESASGSAGLALQERHKCSRISSAVHGLGKEYAAWCSPVSSWTLRWRGERNEAVPCGGTSIGILETFPDKPATLKQRQALQRRTLVRTHHCKNAGADTQRTSHHHTHPPTSTSTAVHVSTTLQKPSRLNVLKYCNSEVDMTTTWHTQRRSTNISQKTWPQGLE